MKTFISFVLRLNLNFLSVLIILDECRGIADQCALNRTANLLPRVLCVVKLESYGKNDHFINVYGNVPLFFQSLKIICATWCRNFQAHCPNAYPKLIFSWDIYLVWRFEY